MRMRDRRAGVGAAVLEHQHVLDLRTREQRRCSLRPQVDDAAHAVDAEGAERCVVLR
jgi:hypothetical protein